LARRIATTNMNTSLNGKCALVTGSTQGIGLATAKELAANGASVILLARDQARLQQAIAQLDTSHGQQHGTIVADMSDTAGLSAALAESGIAGRAVHIVVNNTGGPPPGPAHEAPVNDFASAFRLHLMAYQTLVLTLVPGMKQRREGRIINIISTSVKQPLHNLGVSNTVRGAVAQWSKTLANELGPFGITVNNVLPGATDTERLKAIIRNKSVKSAISEEAAAEEMLKEIPLRRFAAPEELAYAVCFLAGPSGAYINGINLPVDGGRTGCL
jgi:3-oxoacyl-[acyl-carrier protein] reductase